MNMLAILAMPAAIALSLLATPTSAQEKTSKDATTKPGNGAAAGSKAGKTATQSSTALEATNTKALTERSGAKQTTPANGRSAPANERTYESCHGKDSDA